jgi:hypothetical protein
VEEEDLMFIKRAQTIDDKRLTELIDESQDLQVDAMRIATQSIPDLRDLANDRRHDERQPAVRELTLVGADEDVEAGSRWGSRAAAGGAFGVLLAGILAKSAAADKPLDIQILQTASSLERLAVNTYGAALGLDFIKNGNATIVAFATKTMSQHDQHRMAFQAQTTALGGTPQDQPNPKFQAVVTAALPSLKTPADVVTLAMSLEKVATDSYLTYLGKLEDKQTLTLFGSVMGVECQHLATLRAVGALLAGGGEALIAIPTNLAKLPAAAGSVAFPDAIEKTDPALLADPSTGAVK